MEAGLHGEVYIRLSSAKGQFYQGTPTNILRVLMPSIKVINIEECDYTSLRGDVIFYNCSPTGDTGDCNIFDISQDVLRYIRDNIHAFNNYIRQYITNNGNDRIIAQSMLFEFNTLGNHKNKAFELIAIIKAISMQGLTFVTLIVPDDYDRDLLESAFSSAYRFKLKGKWLLKLLIRSIFYFLCFLPLVKLKKILHGTPVAGNVFFHSFVVGDVRLGFRVDPYFAQLIEELKKRGITVNRFAFFAAIRPFSLLKAAWGLDTREFIFPEAFLGIGEVWKSFRYFSSLNNSSNLNVFMFDGCDLTNYMKALSLYLSVCCQDFRTDLMRIYIRKFKIGYRAIVVQNENMFYQRAFFKDFKGLNPSVCSISYQNTALYSYTPNSYFDIFPDEYRPDIIFSSGPFFSEYLSTQLNYPLERVRSGFSLNNIVQGRKYRRSEKPVLCIYISASFFEAEATLDYISKTLLQSDRDFAIGVRFHPYCSQNVVKLFNGLKYFEYESAMDSLLISDCFLSTGTSTIILSAAITEKPVYLLEVSNIPNWMDRFGFSNLKYIKMDETIEVTFFSTEACIDEDRGVSLDATCEEIMRLVAIETN